MRRAEAGGQRHRAMLLGAAAVGIALVTVGTAVAWTHAVGAELGPRPTAGHAPYSPATAPAGPAPSQLYTERETSAGPTRRASRSRRTGVLTRADKGRAALAALPFDVRRIGFRVSFEPGRAGLLGETAIGARQIRLYVRPDESVGQITRVLAHEEGHALDLVAMTSRTRARWLALRGASGTSWWPSQGSSDFTSGTGDFAEVFARWAIGPDMRFRSEVAPEPSTGQLAMLADRFFRVA